MRTIRKSGPPEQQAESGAFRVVGNDPGPVTPENIRVRAYEIFLTRNGASGDAASDWLRAESELNDALRAMRADAQGLTLIRPADRSSQVSRPMARSLDELLLTGG